VTDATRGKLGKLRVMEPRPDDYHERRRHLADLSDEELRRRFWDLVGEIVDPLIDMARQHTSPSIERSVLLRMGFSSLESGAVVRGCVEHGLLERGAGHVVWRVAKDNGLSIRAAGLALGEGNYWDEVRGALKGED